MRPLYNKVKAYKDEVNTRYHMPGHSGSLNICGIDTSFDVTEVPGLDNLLCANGVILEAEKLYAKAYSYKYALMLTEGSTIGMQISIFYARDNGYKIVCLNDMHTSFYNTLALHKIEYTQAYSEDEVINFIKSEKVAIFTTTPSYFGFVKDIKNICDIAHQNNSIVIVDAAHGAHFVYSKELKDLFEKKADIIFTSTHKTMPTLGGGAVLLCNDESIYEKVLLIRQMCHSTSPSYLVLASMDWARDELQKIGEDAYENIKEKIVSFKKFGEFEIVKNDDFSRLVLKKSGYDAYDALLKLSKMGIGIELAYKDELVLIVTPYNVNDLDKLDKALASIELKKLDDVDIKSCDKSSKDLEKLDLKYEEITKCVIGKIAAADIGIYPPAVPVIHRGEIINQDVVDILNKNKGHLFGVVNDKIPVLE